MSDVNGPEVNGPGTRLRIGYWNLQEGGIDSGDDHRLLQMLDRLAAEELDVVLLGEARWSDRGDRQLHAVARRLGATFRCRVPSNYYQCDMAVLIREMRLWVVEERHETGAVKPWFHALGRVQTHVEGFGRCDLAAAHLAPSMPEIRVQEAGAFRLLGKAPMIVGGDFNAAALEDPAARPEEFAADKEHKLDRTPARIIAEAGFRDVGAEHGHLFPTVGFHGQGAYRCDRILTNVPDAQVTDFKVIPPSPQPPLSTPHTGHPDGRQCRHLSDHAGVIAELVLPARERSAPS